MIQHEHLRFLHEKIKNPEKRNWIIMVPNSLAETVVVCGLSKAFIKRYGHGITLVIPESHAFIPQCYPNTFDRVVYLPLGNMRHFSEAGYIPPNFFSPDFPINTWPQQHGDGRAFSLYELWTATYGRSGLNFLDLYRYILRLDWTAEYNRPKVPQKYYVEAQQLIKKFDIKKNKTVILFAGNNSNRPAPPYLWSEIAKNYFKKGFDVLINVRGSMLVPEGLRIEGARIIDIALEHTIPLCEHAGNVVSGSNGFVFLALAAGIDCNMDVLLPNEICYDYDKFLYKDINPMAGCHQLNSPEIVKNAAHLKEWIVPKDAAFNVLSEIAEGITSGAKNKFLIENPS